MIAQRDRGYSFVELMLVVAMMGVLTALVLPTGITIHRANQEEELRKGLARIRTALDAFHLDWEKGCVETDDETGWPESLAMLHDGVEWSESPQCNPNPPPSGPVAGLPRAQEPRKEDEEPEKKIYLRHVPRDPFNREGDELDTMGWKARSYRDEPDSSSWDGTGVYDVYSSSELLALDGTKHSEW